MSTVIENTIDIARSPEAVFDYLADQGNEIRWNPDCVSMEKLTDGPVGVGTDDIGAAFDIDLGSIPANGTKTFYLVYGAAQDESHAQSALVAAQSVVWSIAKPNVPGAGIPNTFFFGVRVP